MSSPRSPSSSETSSEKELSRVSKQPVPAAVPEADRRSCLRKRSRPSVLCSNRLRSRCRRSPHASTLHDQHSTAPSSLPRDQATPPSGSECLSVRKFPFLELSPCRDNRCWGGLFQTAPEAYLYGVRIRISKARSRRLRALSAATGSFFASLRSEPRGRSSRCLTWVDLSDIDSPCLCQSRVS